jgi:hypothetical protein
MPPPPYKVVLTLPAREAIGAAPPSRSGKVILLAYVRSGLEACTSDMRKQRHPADPDWFVWSFSFLDTNQDRVYRTTCVVNDTFDPQTLFVIALSVGAIDPGGP